MKHASKIMNFVKFCRSLATALLTVYLLNNAKLMIDILMRTLMIDNRIILNVGI